MLAAIESGADDLSRTHVPLTALLAASSTSTSSSDTTPPPQVWDLAELQQRADTAIAAAGSARGAAVSPPPDKSVSLLCRTPRGCSR